MQTTRWLLKQPSLEVSNASWNTILYIQMPFPYIAIGILRHFFRVEK